MVQLPVIQAWQGVGLCFVQTMEIPTPMQLGFLYMIFKTDSAVLVQWFQRSLHSPWKYYYAWVEVCARGEEGLQGN